MIVQLSNKHNIKIFKIQNMNELWHLFKAIQTLCKAANVIQMADVMIGRVITALLGLIPTIRSTQTNTRSGKNCCFSLHDSSPSVVPALRYTLKAHLLDYILVQIRAVKICLGAAPYISPFTREGDLVISPLNVALVYSPCLSPLSPPLPLLCSQLFFRLLINVFLGFITLCGFCV